MEKEKSRYKRGWILERQLSHIRKVQDYMILLELNRDELPFYIPEWKLVERGMYHDIDKFSSGLSDNYLLLYEYKQKKKNNIPTDIDKETAEKLSADMHYRKNPHHCDYHMEKGTQISNLDLCEMACDGLAASERAGCGMDGCLKFYRDNKYCEYPLVVEKHDHMYIFLVNLVRLLKIKEKNFI